MSRSQPEIARVLHRHVEVEGLRIFYREAAAPAGAPVLLLLHGFPSGSHQFARLVDALGGRFRLIVPDYPRFGHSDAPPSFAYSFDARSQAWLREHRPPTLVLWGRNDPFFTEAGALAFKRDLPDARVHLFDTGHFALEERVDEIAPLVGSFVERTWSPAGPVEPAVIEMSTP
jgi:pimeloyl-ACP methyl ester carboxylesterase